MSKFDNSKKSIKKLALPRLYMLTGYNPANSDLFLTKLEKHFMKGIKLAQLRAKALSTEEYRKLATSAIYLAEKYDAYLLLNTEIQIASDLNAKGIHLTSTMLKQLTKRPFSKSKLISASCHNKKEFLKAVAIDVDFVTLGDCEDP